MSVIEIDTRERTARTRIGSLESPSTDSSDTASVGADYTMSGEAVADPRVDAETIEGLPRPLVEAFARMAAAHGVAREVDPDVWVASVVGFEGAWADGGTAEEAKKGLSEAIVGWVAVKRRIGAQDIPVIEGLDLNLP